MTKQNELDSLLDKISKKGFDSLTKKRSRSLRGIRSDILGQVSCLPPFIDEL